MTGDGPLSFFIFLKFLINNNNDKSLLVDNLPIYQFTNLPIKIKDNKLQSDLVSQLFSFPVTRLNAKYLIQLSSLLIS